MSERESEGGAQESPKAQLNSTLSPPPRTATRMMRFPRSLSLVRPLIARRFVSTAPTPSPSPGGAGGGGGKKSSSGSGLRSALVSTAVLSGAAAFMYYAHDSRAGIHRCDRSVPPALVACDSQLSFG